MVEKSLFSEMGVLENCGVFPITYNHYRLAPSNYWTYEMSIPDIRDILEIIVDYNWNIFLFVNMECYVIIYTNQIYNCMVIFNCILSNN